MYFTTREISKMFNISNQRVNALVKSLNLDLDTEIRGKSRYYSPLAMKKIFNSRGISLKRKVISVTNLKGGTGKTTACVNLGKYMASLGIKTCIIDADKQSNLTSQFIPDKYEHVLFDIVAGNCTTNEAIIKVSDTLSILPSSLKNSRLENEFSTKKVNHLKYFRDLISSIDAECIIVDTEPNLSHINFLISLGSDLNIIPILLDRYSLEGLNLVLETYREAEENWKDQNIKINYKVLINRFDNRVKSSLEYLSQLNEFNAPIFETVIKTDTSFLRSQNYTELSKSSNAYKDIAQLAFEILEIDMTKAQPSH